MDRSYLDDLEDAYVPPPNHILISHGMRVYNEACHQASLGGHGVL